MCLTILDCIFVCNLNRRVRLVILNLFAVSWKEHRNIVILDVTPFLEGWLIRPGKCASIRLFRQTTVVYPHRHCCVRRKDIKGDDAQVGRCFVFCHEQLSWIIWVCAFAFWERRRRNDFLDRRLDVCRFRRLWFWCCLLLLLKQNDRSCNCDFCWRRSVRSLAKWSSSGSESLCMCSTKMLHVW